MHEQDGSEQREQQEPSPCAAPLPQTHGLALGLLHRRLMSASLLPREWGLEGLAQAL